MRKGRKSTPHAAATDALRGTAAWYSAGILESERAAAFEQHLETGCEVCASEARAFQEIAAGLALALPVHKPPANLRARLIERVAPKPAPLAVLVRAGEGVWRSTGFAGVLFRPLFVDEATGNVTSLVKLDAGAVYPPHRHFGLEHCYVLEGDVVFHDHELHAGDYEVAMAATDHSSVTSKQGCLLLLITNQRDQLLA